ncbi:hypothetical protein [Halorarius halobius]|nr:hypothetical protein [Halorarius halobius]
MATRQQSATGAAMDGSYHSCSCGATFDSTEELLAHAREEHGLSPA